MGFRIASNRAMVIANLQGVEKYSIPHSKAILDRGPISGEGHTGFHNQGHVGKLSLLSEAISSSGVHLCPLGRLSQMPLSAPLCTPPTG